MREGTRSDILGRVVGMLVFLAGVALLVVVFYRAYGLFTAKPAEALGLTITGDPKKDPGATLIGTHFGWMVMQIAFLFIMSIAASLLAQKGINLYFSAIQGVPVNVTARPSSTVSPPA